MSARDAIDIIRTLSTSEIREVSEFIKSIEAKSEPSDPKIMPRETFERAKAHVFAHYGPLLEELAK